ncbi:MAG: hypothetical protein IJR39_06550 [Treponema sp.]|nr:hypothetical protein [Treponema sp.]
MKKSLFFITTCLAVLFFACDDFSNLQIPESISVKTAAKFDIPMGSGSISIREKASLEEIQRILDDNINKNTAEGETKLQPVVYEYNPEDGEGKVSESAVMQYIINYPIKEIPLSIGDKNLANADIEEIDIPETTFTAPDFNSNISDTLTITDKTFQMAEPGASGGSKSISDLGFTFDITSPSFAAMTVREGSMVITITKPTETTVSDDFSMQVKISLVNASDHSNVIATTGDSLIECSQGKTVTLDLAGKSIVQNMYIIIEGTVSGGTFDISNPTAHLHTYGVSMAPSNDFALEKITGLTMTETDLGSNAKIYIPKDFELDGLNSSLKEATIEEGELDFYCKLPDGWSGIKVSESNFLIQGGINIPSENFSPDKDTPSGYVLYKTASLNGLKVVPEKTYTYDTTSVTAGDTNTYTDTNISWLKVSLENATIVFADSSKGETTELTLSGTCKLTKLSNIKVYLNDLKTFSGNEDTGLNFSTILSDIMSGDSKNLIKDIEFADSDTTKLDGYLYVSKPLSDEQEKENSEGKKVLKDLKISGKVCAKYTDKDGNSKTSYLFGSSSSTDSMSMIKPTITFAEAATDGLITNSDVVASGSYSYRIADGKIATLINDLPDGLLFDYTLGLDTGGDGVVDLDGDTIEFLKTTDAKISVSLALVVPLQIKLNDEYDIPDNGTSGTATDGVITIKDVQSLAKKSDDTDPDKDLLDRDSAEDSDFKKYAEALKSATFTYNVTNELIKNLEEYTNVDDSGNTVTHKVGEDLDVKLYLYTVDTAGNRTNIFDNGEKELSVADGTQTLELSSAEITKILSSEGWPFIPKIRAEITVPKDTAGTSMTQYVPRDGAFAVNGTFHIEFDEDIPVEVWSK